MLRASNAATGSEEVPNGGELQGFADALARGADDLVERRSAVIDACGPEAFVEVAAVAAIFHGYVRVADGTGIPLDDLVVATSKDLRASLGVDDFAGRENSNLTIPGRAADAFNPSLSDS